ncbi:MAG: hypothetical protein LBK63_09965 [Treponema sp.]|jgi:hypothetical protein|nr:hypothetical protein [Treponema sp.]
MKYFDRSKIRRFPLAERKNKVDIQKDLVDFRDDSIPIPADLQNQADRIASEMLAAVHAGRSVMLAFGAHAVKNGLGALLGELVKRKWISHLATNGAGVIHDWEFAYQGLSSEDVRENIREGKFGTWEETGFYINAALAVGAYEGLGYGESVGALITRQGLAIPERETLREIIGAPFSADDRPPLWKRSAAADLLDLLETLDIPSGWRAVEHRFSQFSVQAAAYAAGTPFTSHPMFGHDIIYTHRASRGAAIGRVAERDFLSYVESVSNLEGGVYLSVGSAVMSPMIFEKALSMARNAAQQNGRDIRNCRIYVVDLQEMLWDWSSGEPPADNPAYYLRFMKTFNRMGCPLAYITANNRLFFRALYRGLSKQDKEPL